MWPVNIKFTKAQGNNVTVTITDYGNTASGSSKLTERLVHSETVSKSEAKNILSELNEYIDSKLYAFDSSCEASAIALQIGNFSYSDDASSDEYFYSYTDEIKAFTALTAL